MLLPLFWDTVCTSVNCTALICFHCQSLLMAVIIPLFPVLIGAVLSIPLVFIVNYLKRHPFLNVWLSNFDVFRLLESVP